MSKKQPVYGCDKVKQTWEAQHRAENINKTWKLCLLCGLIAAYLVWDLLSEDPCPYRRSQLVWLCKCAVAVICSAVAVIYSLVLLVWVSTSSKLTLTKLQRKLLNISQQDELFDQPKPCKPAPKPPADSSFISLLSTSRNTTIGSETSMNMSLNSSSWCYMPNESFTTPSPIQESALRHRHGSTPACMSTPLSLSPPNSFISNSQDLQEHLKEFDVSDTRDKRKNDSGGSPNCSGFQSFGSLHMSGLLDCSNNLYSTTYQLSPRTHTGTGLTSGTCGEESGAGGTGSYGGAHEELWSNIGVTRNSLTRYNSNLRRWIGDTIICGLLKEIKSVNSTLVSQGCGDLQIGVGSYQQIRAAALTRFASLPSLATILPYINITNNQPYLLARLTSLSQGGCMSEFRWDGGGTGWNEELPTDSQLVFHMLCTYLDSKMPYDPSLPEGNVFTHNHVTTKPPTTASPGGHVMIQHTRATPAAPPHYNICIGPDIVNMPKGRNNLFHSILYFIHHTKTKEAGMLGRVNLGLSGLNLLWVID